MLARNNQLTLYIPTTYVTRIACIPHVGNIHEIERKKKYAPKKIITQDNIYVILQFVHVYIVLVISLFIGKKYKMQQYSSLLKQHIKT